MRTALKEIVEGSLPKMKTWLGQDWAGSDGAHRARLLAALIEYAAPKLNRADPMEAAKPRTADDMSDEELTLIARVGVRITFPEGSPGESSQIQSARVATAADFGMTEPVPAALPAPAPRPELPALVLPEPRQPDPAMARAAAPPQGGNGPLEGEVIERPAPAEVAQIIATPTVTWRMKMAAEFQEYLEREVQYVAEQRRLRNDPYLRVTEFELRQALGPRPVNPASLFSVM